MTSIARATLALGLFVVPAPSASEAAIEPVPMIAGEGLWTVAELGYRGIDAKPRKRIFRMMYRYRLPAGSRQGKPSWYLVHLSGRIEFAQSSGRGFVTLMATTSRRASAQLTFFSKRTNGRVQASINTTSIVDGGEIREATGRAISFTYANFLRDQGVVEGVNTLEVTLAQYQNARIKRFNLDEFRSGIERTRRGPALLRLAPSLEESMRPGERSRLKVIVKNVGGRPATNVAVRLHDPTAAFDEIKPAIVRLGTVETTKEAHFVAKARSRGVHQLAALADSSANSPGTTFSVPVGIEETWRERAFSWAVVTLVVAASLLALSIVRSLRERGSTGDGSSVAKK